MQNGYTVLLGGEGSAQKTFPGCSSSMFDFIGSVWLETPTWIDTFMKVRIEYS